MCMCSDSQGMRVSPSVFMGVRLFVVSYAGKKLRDCQFDEKTDFCKSQSRI